MKMKGTKRVLAMLLALCMTLFAVPFPANAETSPEVEYSTDGGVTWTDQDLLANAIFNVYLQENSIIRLKRDITLSSSWTMIMAAFSNCTVTLDGAGHTISRGSTSQGFFILSQSNSHMILKNITLDGGAVWDDPSAVDTRTNSGVGYSGNAHFFTVSGDSTLTLDSGTVLQNNHLNNSAFNGAAVCLSGGTLIMKDGAKIINNTAAGSGGYGGGGGAVQVGSSAAFYMQGGEISGNYASVSGGAVYAGNGGIFQMTGGTIKGNASGNNSGAVGGATGYQVKLTGGEISGNKASVGGALLPWDMVEIGGDIRITGNHTLAGRENNVHIYFPENHLTITSAMTEQAKIGVTTKTLPAADSPVTVAKGGGSYAIANADRTKFYPDSGDYRIALQNGLLQMRLAAEVDERSAVITATASIPAPTYTVTIPPSVDVGELTRKEASDAEAVKSTKLTVTASNIANLFDDKKITVTATPNHGVFELADGDNKLAYELYAPDGTKLTSGAAFMEFTANGSKDGRIDIDQSTITRAGSYSGTLTFTIALSDAA